MASFNKFNKFAEDVGKGVHVFGTHQLKVALTNVAPSAANAVLADLTEIVYTNLSSRNITTTSFAQSAGLAKLILASLNLTASGGAVATFRYVVLYNDTPASPLKPLIGWYDNGSAVTLADGQSYPVNFDPTNGALTIQ